MSQNVPELRPIPKGFAEDAKHMPILALRDKYSIGQGTFYRWMHELAASGLVDRRRVTQAQARLSPKFPCGHPRIPENTVGQRKQACRQCQHEYKRRVRMGHLKASPGYDHSVTDSHIRAGSDELLRAIWREHPEVLQVLAAKGRCVVQPKGDVQ